MELLSIPYVSNWLLKITFRVKLNDFNLELLKNQTIFLFIYFNYGQKYQQQKRESWSFNSLNFPNRYVVISDQKN